jgi:penicillin-binding protein 1A
MLDVGFIGREQAEQALAEPLVMQRRPPTEVVTADYFSEEVRRELIQQHGEDFLYQGGLSIRTTVSPTLQAIADQALSDGLIAYDRRHGWRGPKSKTAWHLEPGGWSHLAEIDRSDGRAGWQLALVMAVDAEAATIGLGDGSEARLPLGALKWAHRQDADGNLGPSVERADQVLDAGDVIWVEQVAAADDTAEAAPPATYALRQPPAVEGAIVALDPHTGRVLAMRGGFSYARSVFNRATQALRQPGSALKPFVYLAALEQGFTPSSILLDAPIVIDQGPGLGKWKPANYSKQFYGPSTLRLGLEKSRNVMTVRLAQSVGMSRIIEMASRFGLDRGLGHNLASALGSNEVGLLQLTTAYAMLVNGGKRIEPALIERIQDRHGRTISRRDPRPCPGCQDVAWEGQPAPLLPDEREQVVSPARAYQMVNLLTGVVERGTGQRARSIDKPLAGKTGTTDDSRDAWFIGFTPDLVVGVFVGFDQPKSLGQDEQGASVALPVFIQFMEAALKDQPATPFRVPPGVRLVRVDAETGLLPGDSTRVAILEAYLPGTEPTSAGSGQREAPLNGQAATPALAPSNAPQTGGLY